MHKHIDVRSNSTLDVVTLCNILVLKVQHCTMIRHDISIGFAGLYSAWRNSTNFSTHNTIAEDKNACSKNRNKTWLRDCNVSSWTWDSNDAYWPWRPQFWSWPFSAWNKVQCIDPSPFQTSKDFCAHMKVCPLCSPCRTQFPHPYWEHLCRTTHSHWPQWCLGRTHRTLQLMHKLHLAQFWVSWPPGWWKGYLELRAKDPHLSFCTVGHILSDVQWFP